MFHLLFSILRLMVLIQGTSPSSTTWRLSRGELPNKILEDTSSKACVCRLRDQPQHARRFHTALSKTFVRHQRDASKRRQSFLPAPFLRHRVRQLTWKCACSATPVLCADCTNTSSKTVSVAGAITITWFLCDCRCGPERKSAMP